MNSRKTTLLLLLFLGLVVPSAFAQDISTEGTDFWVSFMGNGFKNNTTDGQKYLKTQVLISSLHDCAGTITNPNTGWTTQFTIEADGVVIIDIPEEVAYMECDDYTTPLNKSLHIVTNQPVSVYCANAARYSFDASYVLPTPALADDYLIQTYDQAKDTEIHTSAFLIIAVEEGETVVDITPSVKTLDDKPAGEEYSITLHQGQVYQVRSHNTSSFFGGTSRDLSGSRVKSQDCKKIAVFNGSNLTMVPTSGNDSDCIFEQAMPLQSWGKQFVVTASLGRENKDYVKITSASNNNEITVNGQYYATLSANESRSFKVQETSYFIEASNRCAVYLYNHSKDGGPNVSSGFGAPSMVWIAPIEQRINELAFNTFNDLDPGHVSVDRHYVNIIVESRDASHVVLDGNPIAESQFDAVAGNSGYKFYRQEISHGAHHLSCEGGFNAHVYGFGRATGYAYMVGSKAADLTTSITVNEAAINPFDTVVNCAMEDFSFRADINLYDYNLVWDFGDGTSSTDNPVTHHYNESELYEATLTVTSEEPPCGGTSATSTTSFYIDLRREPDQAIGDTICFRGPGIYNENNFEIHYEAPGVYHDIDTIINESGCESYIRLDLIVDEIVDLEPETKHTCNFFEWHDHIYTLPGHYLDTVDSQDCYTVHHLNLELDYSPKPKIVSDTYNATISGDTIFVVTNTEFFSFQYDFYVIDTLDHIDDWESCHWHISKPSWVMQPFENEEDPDRHYCRVFVAERDDDYVELTCTVYNHCEEDSITTTYYLKSSFLGVNAQETTSSRLDIVTNPNNGEMDLHLEQLTGKVSIKVYDMHGSLVDVIETYNELYSKTLHYSMRAASSGIYFFVATAKEGTLSKKVIIE